MSLYTTDLKKIYKFGTNLFSLAIWTTEYHKDITGEM
jgi:hypothetical protein